MSKPTLLLFGGVSEERLVSVASAQNLAQQYKFTHLIFQALDEKLYEVSLPELIKHQNPFLTEFKPTSPPFADSISKALSFFQGKTVFLGLHGSQGENGELQTLFEGAGVCFAGSGARASRFAFEKDLGKKVISATDIRMAPQIKFEREEAESLRPRFAEFLAQYKKMVLKPTSSGSSYGLHVVADEAQLKKACEEIKKSAFRTYLAEAFITGRELTVGVLQTESGLRPLPASEVVLTGAESFDYNGKYLGKGSREITPADLTATELAAVQDLAMKAHAAFGCYGYSRTDVILSADGPYFLETNTLPGLTKASFIPQQLEAAGISFQKFVADQLTLAEKRYETDKV